jgi:hypothetical protein
VDAELRVHEFQTSWLLGQLAKILEDASPALWTAVSPAAMEANSLLAIAKHASSVTRAYVLGIACGLPVERDRATEFSAEASEAPAILDGLRRLPEEIAQAFETLAPGTLDKVVRPGQALFGTGEPREMSCREAIVENIRHLGIHLGEMRLTRSLLESRAD